MSASADAVIQADTTITGSIRNGGHVEIFGIVDGDVAARELVVRPGGKVVGSVTVETLEVHGLVQGKVAVKHLIDLGPTGEIFGEVRYSEIRVAPGGLLSADLRNVPPTLFGDFEIQVAKGRQVALTGRDIAAVDPDDDADDLRFTVTNIRHGWIAMGGAAGEPVTAFSQADINSGRVMFVHDGTGADTASFDVVVADDEGATAGPKTVRVAVT